MSLLRVSGVLLVVAVGCGGGKSGESSGLDGSSGSASATAEVGRYVTVMDAGTDADPPPPSLAPTSLGGTIILPNGVGSLDGGLAVAAVLGTTTPAADGTFVAAGAGPSMQGVLVLDSGGDPVLVGWAKPGKQATVSTTSTAAALLAVYAGIGLFPHNGWERAIDLLMAAPQTADLAKFLDTKLASNPKFLTLATAEDQQALAVAVAEALAGFLPTLRKAHQALVLVKPSDQQSGITLLIGDKDGNSVSDVNMVTFMNAYRRRATAFIDRQTGKPPVETYTQEAEIEITPTVGVNGLVGTVGDYLAGKVAYAPVYIGPIGLGNVMTDDEELSYRVRVVGLGRRSTLALTAKQDSQRLFIATKSVVVDAFMPTALQFMPTEWLMYVFESRYFSEFLKEMTNQAYNGGLLSFGELVSQADVMGAMRNLAWTLGNQSGARQWFIGSLHDVILKTFPGDGAAKAAEFSYKAGAVLLRWMELVDKALALIDVTTLASQAAVSDSANEWQVTVRAPKVILTPAKMTLACGEKRGLIAQVKNGGQTLSGDLVYEFTNTAQYGHLTSDVNPSYKDNFTATKPNVYYTANATGLQQGGIDTIEVAVYLLAPNGSKDRQLKQLIGKTKAQVTMASECSNSEGYVANQAAYTSGCTHVLTGPLLVYPDDEVTVTASAAYGGVCGTAWVWMSYAVSARLDDGPDQTGGGGSGGVYDFCYGGDPQPMVPGGAGVALPDGETHTITFKIDPAIRCPVCVREVLDGTPCSSNPGNRQNISGPAVVMGGNGGTHGWSTVHFFAIEVDR